MGRSFKNSGWLGFLLILAGAAIGACGGGAVGDMASTGGGTGGTGISVGSVSAFGSVYVNGVRYDTSNAEIVVEGQSKGFGDQAVLTQFSVGMVVRVEGEIEDAQNGTASRVYFNDDVRGPVESIREIDSDTTELTVLGKAIILEDITETGGYDIETLALDDWVQVSGFQDADGRIRATFLTGSASHAKANLKGLITQLNTVDRQFTINGLVVDFQVADLVGMTQLSDNLLVEVTGSLALPGNLTAEKIERVDLLGATDSENVELEGVISEKVSDTQLSLNGVTIILDAQTDYSYAEPSEIVSCVRVEVEGELVGGILYARKVILLDFAKVASNVNTNQADQSEISLVGLTDITIRYNEFTKVTGAVKATEDVTGDHHVKIIGRKTVQNNLQAVHIIVKSNFDSKVILQGQLDSHPGPTITILGHAVDLFPIPDENFESPEGVIVGYDEFLSFISMGDVVSAKGELSGDQVLWQSIAAE